MSKVFEALQRLERETGSPSSGILVEAQRILSSGPPILHEAPSMETATEPEREPPAPNPKAAEAPEVTGAPEVAEALNFGTVPIEYASITPESRIIYHTEPDSPGADRFRLLRMHLWPLSESGKLKTLLVTSAQAQDGKSTIVLNLATALAEHGARKVLVIEGDLHHPSLRSRLGHRDAVRGLAECLEDQQNPLPFLRRIEPLSWYLLPAGVGRGNPTELLQSPFLANIFEMLRQQFDWILVDTPPVMPLTDTLSLRPHAEACLMVMRAGCTPKSLVDAAIKRVGTQHIVGLVLNGAEEVDRLYSGYHKSYRTSSKKVKK